LLLEAVTNGAPPVHTHVQGRRAKRDQNNARREATPLEKSPCIHHSSSRSDLPNAPTIAPRRHHTLGNPTPTHCPQPAHPLRRTTEPRCGCSDLLGLHLDRAAGALGGADAAALAEVVVDPVWLAGVSELDHRVVRADPVAVVAGEAVPAREAPARLVERG